MIINGITIAVGMEVKFGIHSKTDKQTYRGKVVGIGSFYVAKTYTDVVAIHNSMTAEVASVQIATQEFILIQTTDGAIRAFAQCWIIVDSFDRTDDTSDVQIIVHGVTSLEAANVVTMIRNVGFEVTIITK